MSDNHSPGQSAPGPEEAQPRAHAETKDPARAPERPDSKTPASSISWIRAIVVAAAIALVGGVIVGEFKNALRGQSFFLIAEFTAAIIYGVAAGDLFSRMVGRGHQSSVRFVLQIIAAATALCGIFLGEVEFLIRLGGGGLNLPTLAVLAYRGLAGNALSIFGSGSALLLAASRVK